MNIEVSDVPQEPVQSPVAAARGTDTAHLVLGKRFDIVDANKEEENKLAEIWAYAKQAANSEDIEDIMWEVINLEGNLGSPRLGERRIDRLYRYAKLKRQEAQIQTELKDVSLTGRIHRQW